ncbi:hypothetical protein ACH41E_14465 [Streptomyces sp. NPDC020412]
MTTGPALDITGNSPGAHRREAKKMVCTKQKAREAIKATDGSACCCAA